MVAAEVHEALANGLPDRNSGGSRGGLSTRAARRAPRRPWILSWSGYGASVSPQQRSKRATRRPPSLGFARRSDEEPDRKRVRSRARTFMHRFVASCARAVDLFAAASMSCQRTGVDLRGFEPQSDDVPCSRSVRR
jgi:hypothetical protein